MSKLWKVEVTRETIGYAIVFADTEDEAIDLARDNKCDILDDGDDQTDYSSWSFDNADNLPWGWSHNDIPYGADSSIGELLASEVEPRVFRDTYTIDMFAEARP